jgi:hypothetical protein
MADPGRVSAGSRGSVGVRTLSMGEVLRAGGMPTPFLFGPDGRPLPQETFRSPIDYGPGQPLPPRIAEPNYAPRESTYPLGFNLSLTPRQEYSGNISFATLRTLADLCPYARVAIEYRKKKVRGRKIEFVARENEKSKALKAKLQDQIDRATNFWAMPNRIDGVGYTPWIGQLVEEMMVTDALALFKHRRVDGGLHSLVQIDGTTLKPLIDQWAHVVGYEQIIWGLPATAYDVVREMDVDLNEGPRAYDKSELLYLVYNPRVDSVYGTSPLEEIKPTIDTAIRRALSQLAYYTDGNIPQGLIEAPEGWSTKQIAELETYLVENFAGDIQKNAQLRVVPHGSNYKAVRPIAFTKDEEEAMASLILAMFAVPKTILVAQHNRSEGENQSDEAEDAGDAPLMAFLLEFIDGVTQGDLDCPDIKAVVATGRAATSKETSDSYVALVNAGILTKDEARAEMLGLEPLPEEKPPVPVPGQPPLPGQSSPDDEPSDDEEPVNDDAAKAELATWRRFAMKRAAKGRAGDAFETKALPQDLAVRIHVALEAASTEADVAEVFELAKVRKARRLSASRTKTDEKAITSALTEYFEREYGRAEDVGQKRLKENAA